MVKIIAINAGSSSLKFQLFNMPHEQVISKGNIERIGLDNAIITISVGEKEISDTAEIRNHSDAVKQLLNKLTELSIIHSLDEIDGVGHRVVHGGEYFADSALITKEVMGKIESLSYLAPLHNPANIIGIKAFQKELPHVPAVAVFDTSFHQTMPEVSYLYSLPYEYYEKYGIRKYGFHGTSHKYVTRRAAELLDRPIEELRLISCHLGNGVSIAAVKAGKSIDTSMGFTPLAGATMGTRTGNIDAALIPFIMEKTGNTIDKVMDVLNRESGLLGISGFSSDLRDIENKATEGDHRAELALDIFSDRVRKYIGSYTTRMGGVDAIIFTAGIGENSATIRAKVLNGLEFMGVYWSPSLNKIRGEESFINYPDSNVKALVIPTDEELMIARDVMRLKRKTTYE